MVPRAWFCWVIGFLVLGAASHAQQWRDPSPHDVRMITVDRGVRLEVLHWGGSGRAVVFLGCYLSGHMFDDIAPKLTDRFHVYAFTRRGILPSDRPARGYELQRSADDLLAVLDALKLRAPILAANSCGGWTATKLAVEYPDRVGALVYLEAADDPMVTLADYNLPDEAELPRRIDRPALDFSSFDAYRRTQKARAGVAFPEAELRHGFHVNPDGSMGGSTMSSTIRRAVTTNARSTPEFSRVRVPVLALFRTPLPLEEIEHGYTIQTEAQRAALRRSVEAERTMTQRWERDLRAAIPSAKIVEVPGASIYMHLSNEADVMREIRAFAATIKP